MRHGDAMGHIDAVKLCLRISRVDERAQVCRHGGKGGETVIEGFKFQHVTHVGLVFDSIVGIVDERKSYGQSNENVQECRG